MRHKTRRKKAGTGQYSTEFLVKEVLKVFTIEKRGGLTVVSFDRSRGKLFSQKFSNELVHPVRGLKLLLEPCFYYFANNNCFLISA